MILAGAAVKPIVLHDYFAAAEGGGKLCLVLAQGLNADLGYGFRKPDHPFFQDQPTTSFQHDLAAYSIFPLWQQLKLSLAFSKQTQFLKNYTHAIYSGFYAPLAVRNHTEGCNILYCHTPPRFIYDQQEFYMRSLPAGLRFALRAFIDYLQPRYEQSIAQMDAVITNSKNTQQRIHRYLNKESIVIYPPCDTAGFVWRGQGNYYLSTARLDPLKRVELIVKAFLQMPDKRLIVASGGDQFQYLRKLAGHASNIEFTGWIDNERLTALVGNAIATIYLPKDEDFGMSPVESMAAGKPVIGVSEGGLLETIIAEETGLLLDSVLTIDAICNAVNVLNPQRALVMRYACEARAKHFDTAIFLQKMREIMI